jgi:hypothetical protein
MRTGGRQWGLLVDLQVGRQPDTRFRGYDE